MKSKYIILIIVFLVIPIFAHSTDLNGFHNILERGYFYCGVYKNDYVMSNTANVMETSLCHMISTAIFDTTDAVEIIPMGGNVRFEIQNKNIIDIMYASTTWTMTRDIFHNINYANVYYFEKLVLASFPVDEKEIHSISEVKLESKICTTADTIIVPMLWQIVGKYPLKKLHVDTYESVSGLKRAFLRKDCNLIGEKESIVAEILKEKSNNNEKITVLDEVIGQSLLTTIVDGENANDFKKLSKWLMNGLLRAEKKGITKHNIDEMLNSKDRETLFMLGEIKGIGKPFQIDDKWLYRVIKKYGNYKEFFSDYVNNNKSYTIDRSFNNLVDNGGFEYAYPFD